VWATNHETTGWIDVILCTVVEQVRRDNGHDHMLHQIRFDLLVVNLVIVLRRDQDRIDPKGLAKTIFDSDL
jgi:hypothetical protein